MHKTDQCLLAVSSVLSVFVKERIDLVKPLLQSSETMLCIWGICGSAFVIFEPSNSRSSRPSIASWLPPRASYRDIS